MSLESVGTGGILVVNLDDATQVRQMSDRKYHWETFRAGEDPGGGGGRYFERLVEGPEPDRSPCRHCSLCTERRRAAEAAALVSEQPIAV